jgi:carboxyl-terminal processing protease
MTTAKQRQKIINAVKKRVLKNHFNAAGVNYTEWITAIDTRTPHLLTTAEDDFETELQEMLRRLKSSHTGFYHEKPNRLFPQHTINASLWPPEGDGGLWYFLDVFPEGPADRAGIKPGHKLHQVDGVPYVAPAMPPFKTGHTHTLVVSEPHNKNIREITLELPRKKTTKELPPLLPPKSMTHSVIAPGIGLLRITWFPGAMGLKFAHALDSAIAELKRSGCDRLIIDLRGNIGGGLGFARLASYLCSDRIPIGYSLTPKRLRKGFTTKDLERVVYPDSRFGFATALTRFAVRDKSIFLLTQGLGDQPFHGKIAILVNQWTNSAAEMLVSFAAEYRLATIIGTKTAGNVLGAVNFKVGGGYFLRLPVFGWYTVKGDCVESQGVSPDLAVEVNPFELNSGTDQQMIAAISVLSTEKHAQAAAR